MSDFHYAVEGSWPFPTDMLRHDGSEPATPDDAEKIRLLSGDSAPDLNAIRETTSIDLVIREAGRRRPNTARWESFRWSVPGDAVHASVKSGEAESRRRKEAYDRAMKKLTDEEVEAVRWHLARH